MNVAIKKWYTKNRSMVFIDSYLFISKTNPTINNNSFNYNNIIYDRANVIDDRIKAFNID